MAISSMATKASVFQSPHLVFFSNTKQKYYCSNKPTTSPCPQTISFHFPSKIHKKKSQIFVCKANNIQLGEVVEITDETWKERVIESEIPVIVEFWAPSCGPCKMVAPVMDNLAKEYVGRVAWYKINTDECLKMASSCGIRSIPTVLLFKDGEQKESITGAVSKTAFYDLLGKYL